MRRHKRKRPLFPALIVGYDFETTKIQKGTPRPLYITAYGTRPAMHYASPIRDMMHLQRILLSEFLIEENHGVKFVAWNGNNFDAYFVAAALVTCDDFVMRPYLTQSKSLRGIRVVRREHLEVKGAPSWEFLDGIAMLGLIGVKLVKLLQTFAPHLPKLEGAIDFEREQFDPDKPAHCDYAMRDSVGLEFAMMAAQRVIYENFEQPLAVTMGGACIRILKAHLPEEVTVMPCGDKLLSIVRRYAMRGGYCYCVRRFEGPIWKFDLNQAYASAMRETHLPSGSAQRTLKGIRGPASFDGASQSWTESPLPACYLARIEAWHPGNRVPFYCRGEVGGKVRSLFALEHIPPTWICSNELEQLQREGWTIELSESWGWSESFNLKDYVDKLERRRMTCPGGPSGPEGTMLKAVGNHSYGKMLEELEPIEYVIASEAPEGYAPTYVNGEVDPLEHIYERFLAPDEVHPKDYHQPHIGAFITAHVRMVVRRAALLDPESWLYADTDCVVFARDPSAGLDIDPKRYGAWKIEEAGTPYQIIAKKVYANTATGEGSAKGLHVKQVTPGQFTEWLHGTPPVQHQVQRNNFLRVMQGAEMYRAQTRSGTAVEASESFAAPIPLP